MPYCQYFYSKMERMIVFNQWSVGTLQHFLSLTHHHFLKYCDLSTPTQEFLTIFLFFLYFHLFHQKLGIRSETILSKSVLSYRYKETLVASD